MSKPYRPLVPLRIQMRVRRAIRMITGAECDSVWAFWRKCDLTPWVEGRPGPSSGFDVVYRSHAKCRRCGLHYVTERREMLR